MGIRHTQGTGQGTTAPSVGVLVAEKPSCDEPMPDVKKKRQPPLKQAVLALSSPPRSRGEESIAIKHTGAVHMAGTLSLLQRKAANVLLKYAYKNLTSQETHRVKLSEIARDLGWSITSNTNEKLKDAIRKLNITQIEWNILGKDNKHEWGVATILAEAIIRDGYCTYAYSPTMRKLQANPTLYARLDLIVQQSFDRVYTLALWEFLTEALCSGRNLEVQTAWIKLEDFRRLMGANTPYYQNFSKFNSKIIAPALEEVNEKSDIQVALRTECVGRTVQAISFVASRKLVPEDMEEELGIANGTGAAPGQGTASLATMLEQEFGLSSRNADKLVMELGQINPQELDTLLSHIRKRAAAGEIKNLPAYTAMALKGRYTEKPSTSQQPTLPDYGEDPPVAHPIWQQVRQQIKPKIGEGTYYHWIRDLVYTGTHEGKVTLVAKNIFIRDWLMRYYQDMLCQLWHEAEPEVTALEIIADATGGKKKPTT